MFNIYCHNSPGDFIHKMFVISAMGQVSKNFVGGCNSCPTTLVVFLFGKKD